MAKLEDILHKYKEDTVRNILDVEIVGGNINLAPRTPTVLELIKFDNDEMLFSCGKEHLRVRCDKEVSLHTDLSPDGIEKYNYLFWVESDGINNTAAKIHFMKTGRMESHTDIDIAFGDDIIFYVTQRGNKQVSLDSIAGTLYSWFAFKSDDDSYLFIETFPNSTRNFRIHGLKSHVDVNVEDGKWVLHRITKKPFPSKYSDFLSYNPVKYSKLNFVEQSAAREALETINLRDKTTGDTVISLWEKYSSIEQQRATDFKTNMGKLSFSNAVQKKDGVTLIKLLPNEEQRAIIKDDIDAVLNASFAVVGRDVKFSFKTLDPHSMIASIVDEDYPLKQNEEGELEVDIRGDEAVERRRKRALSSFKSNATLVLINLRFAIEGNANAMLPKPRKHKPLSDRTRAFIKKQFGIEDLTVDQKTAVDIAINTPDVCVIQGPPGTGKSTVVAVICQRLMELAEKENKADKVILVSAFQNDTVEHIASKIYTNGLPTIKIGKDVQGIKAEESFIYRMRNSIDDAIHKLAPENHVGRVSKQLSDLGVLLESEGNEDEVKTRISQMLVSLDISEDLRAEWSKLNRSIKVESGEKDKLLAAVKGLRTDVDSYSDDGFIRIRKLLRTSLPLLENEKTFLEDAPEDEEDLTEEFLVKLKALQEKYVSALLADENTVKGGVNTALSSWLSDAIMEFRDKEEKSYDDLDTFLTATLESLRSDLFGNTQYIKDTIQHYAQSIAATNQFAGSQDVSDTNYENVVLEEAARSNPLDLLIPMVRASERIIMVGDQFQLPHLLENDIVDEAIKEEYELRKKYEESLFGIIFNNLEQANPVRRITLSNQFRMHPVIGNFISKTYYNGIISSDLVKVESKQHGLQLPWAKGKVAVFCDVPGSCGPEYRGGKSKERRAEAERIVKLLDELQNDPAFDHLNVGIITFYSKQVDLICEVASSRGYTELDGNGSYVIKSQYQMTPDGREKLRIGSVDSFQGKEFDIVILSTVRSNNFKRIDENNLKVFGFLTLGNRLNVAFSRAQKLVITVGDRNMFSDEFAETYVKGLYEFNKLTEGEYGNRIQ